MLNRLVGAVYVATRELGIPPSEVAAWVRTFLPPRKAYGFSDAERERAVREALARKN